MNKTLTNSLPDKSLQIVSTLPLEDVKHLLSRALIGVSSTESKIFVNKSRYEVVRLLLRNESNLPSKPLKDYNSIHSGNPDSAIAWGRTWVHDQNHDSLINEKRKISLKNWIVATIYQENQQSIAPAMFLYWCDFFGLEASRIPFALKLYNHIDILRNNAVGNYLELFVNVLTDPALLNYFKKIAPKNAKLLEFTSDQLLDRFLGGPGFSESISNEKRKKIIRLLNKWSVICDSAPIHYSNIRAQDIYHENNQQYLQAYFNRPDAREVLSDISSVFSAIMKNKLVSQHLTRHLYRYFLSPIIDEEAENLLIRPVADAFLESNYDICKWLSCFLQNEYFYRDKFRNGKEKGPLLFLIRLLKQLSLEPRDATEIEKYVFWDWIRNSAELLGQSICDSTASNIGTEINEKKADRIAEKDLYARYVFVHKLIDSGIMFKGKTIKVEPIKIATQCHNASNPLELTLFLFDYFQVSDYFSNQQSLLAEIYLDEREGEGVKWTQLWTSAMDQKNTKSMAEAETRLIKLFGFLLTQPGYNYF